jgi:hypothetical protein
MPLWHPHPAPGKRVGGSQRGVTAQKHFVNPCRGARHCAGPQVAHRVFVPPLCRAHCPDKSSPHSLTVPVFPQRAILVLIRRNEVLTPDPVAMSACSNLRRRDGFGDDVWRVLLGEGLLATSLSFGELTRLGRLNRSCRRLHDAAWSAIWCVFVYVCVCVNALVLTLEQDLRRRRARANFAARRHKREGAARDGACAGR